jgi:N-methylhydantoinase A
VISLDAPSAGRLFEGSEDGGPPGLRVGVDVGGTFTKAVALEVAPLRLLAHAVVPTTHAHPSGVTAGVVAALGDVIEGLCADARRVQLVAFSTTQAMNALLEGDVPRVGVIGIGASPDTRLARRRTRVGEIALAPGRSLRTEHTFLDATRGLTDEEIEAALDRLLERGCEAIAVSGAFAVDSPTEERRVAELAGARGLPACPGHELSGAYGLETRTVSAAINASILPVVERTAGLVERGLEEAGVEAPLLVLRGDGGAMSANAFRRRPSFSVGSGPAAGVAAALHQLGVADAIVIESGGTSSNVSVVRGGRPVLRSVRVMGRPTAIRSIDSWVVGAAGGSLARCSRRGVAETGPRSAHVAALPYACFADPSELEGGQLELISPRAGDPGTYATLRTPARRHALTVTCAANALGLVPEGAHSRGSREAALRAFRALATRMRRRNPEDAARALLDGAVTKVADAVAEAAAQHDLGGEVPLVALGGAAEALVPEVARRTGRAFERPEHPEILSSIGAALSLLRAEAARSATGMHAPRGRSSPEARVELARAAERACVDSGAAPASVVVEVSYDSEERVMRAVATGAAALEAGGAARRPAGDAARLEAAAGALAVEPERLSVVAGSEFYRVYTENGSGRVAVVDSLGGVALSGQARRIVYGRGEEFVRELGEAVDSAALDLGLTRLMPIVSVLCGPRLLDLSDARRAEEILAAARGALEDHDGHALAVISR